MPCNDPVTELCRAPLLAIDAATPARSPYSISGLGEHQQRLPVLWR